MCEITKWVVYKINLPFKTGIYNNILTNKNLEHIMVTNLAD